MNLRALKERFEIWAEDNDLCTDQLFMSSDGVPDNPYEDGTTRAAYGAWMTAFAQSRNYTADRECEPTAMTFFNGRRVFIRDGYLDIENVSPASPFDQPPQITQ